MEEVFDLEYFSESLFIKRPTMQMCPFDSVLCLVMAAVSKELSYFLM